MHYCPVEGLLKAQKQGLDFVPPCRGVRVCLAHSGYEVVHLPLQGYYEKDGVYLDWGYDLEFVYIEGVFDGSRCWFVSNPVILCVLQFLIVLLVTEVGVSICVLDGEVVSNLHGAIPVVHALQLEQGVTLPAL